MQRHAAVLSSLLPACVLVPLAGCGGGGSPDTGSPQTRQGTLARFDVDVKTGKVTITKMEDPDNPSRAVFTGHAVSFTSTDLLRADGDSGKRLVRINVATSTNPNESLQGARLIIGNLVNSGTPDAKNNTLVSPFAGTGTPGSAEGFRTSALFNQPGYILAPGGDPARNAFYVSDTGNHTIRKVDAQGFVTIIAGVPGSPGFANGVGTTARFNQPGQLAWDGPNIIVADTGNRRIRLIAPDGTVTTIAGTGAAGNDEGFGHVATFNRPMGVAIGVVNNLRTIYVTDGGNHNIRRLRLIRDAPPDRASSYTVDTVAGPRTGQAGFVNGNAATARFNAPSSLARIDNNTSMNDYVVTDTGNHAIRQFSEHPAGGFVQVSTIAGDGTAGNADGSVNMARFNSPAGIAVIRTNQGNTFFVSEKHQIRAIVNNSQVVTLAGSNVAGYGEGNGHEARFSSPTGLVAYHVSGTSPFPALVYVADPGNHRLRKLNVSGSLLHSGGPETPITEPVRLLNADSEVPNRTAWVKTLAGAASGLEFYIPAGVSGFSFTATLEADTNLFNLPAAGAASLATLAGDGLAGFSDGPGKLAQFAGPYGVVAVPKKVRAAVPALAQTRAFVVDADNHLIRTIDLNGNVGTLAGGLPGFFDGQGAAAQFRRPRGIALSPDGVLYVADTDNNRIRRITPDGWVTTVAGTGTSGAADGFGDQATLDVPEGIVVDAGRNIYFTSVYAHVVRRLRYISGDPGAASSYQVTTIAGQAYASGPNNGTGGTARFNNPVGIAADTDGTLYVADASNQAVRVLRRAGPTEMSVSTLASGFGTPTGIAVDPAHNVYLSDFNANLIRRVSPQGNVVTLMGAAGSGFVDGANGQFNGPRHLTVEDSGNVLVTDYRNRALRVLQRVISDAQPP